MDALALMSKVVTDLEHEILRVATAHAGFVRAAEQKLKDYGIPREELGFLPTLSGASRAELQGGLLGTKKVGPGGLRCGNALGGGEQGEVGREA